MKFLLAAALALLVAGAQAQDRRAVQQLEEKGFTRCAKATGNVLEVLFEKQPFAFLNTWHSARPNQHLASTLTTPGAQAFASVATAPTADGCDASFNSFVVVASACAQVHESNFKAWNRAGDLAGIPVYAEPGAPNVVVLLFPAAAGSCLVVKSGVLYF